MPSVPARAGFVLAGGSSRRMGRDKALLPYRGGTLVEHVAGRVCRAAGSVTLIGPVRRYSELGLPIVEDLRFRKGPLAGIEAALATSRAPWNLIVACDMPAVTARFLTLLLKEAEQTGCRCLIPNTPEGQIHPLCAVYRRDCLPAIQAALDAGVRKVCDVLSDLAPEFIPVRWRELRNANTPADWGRV